MHAKLLNMSSHLNFSAHELEFMQDFWNVVEQSPRTTSETPQPSDNNIGGNSMPQFFMEDRVREDAGDWADLIPQPFLEAPDQPVYRSRKRDPSDSLFGKRHKKSFVDVDPLDSIAGPKRTPNCEKLPFSTVTKTRDDELVFKTISKRGTINIPETTVLQDMISELESEVQRLKDKRLCVVCLDKPKNQVIFPCMHLCLCETCSQVGLVQCPLCRKKIERVERIYD